MQYRYIFLTGAKKYLCPNCGRRSFKPYVDTHTGEILEKYGKCDHLDTCGYAELITRNGLPDRQNFAYRSDTFQKKVANYVDYGVLEATRGYECGLVQWLKTLPFDTSKARRDYNLTSVQLVKYFSNKEPHYVHPDAYFGGGNCKLVECAIFWQIDKAGNIRTGRLQSYDSITGKSTDTVRNYVHRIACQPDFVYSGCFFGEHLINRGKPLAIVESEKTAIICASVMPQYTWLATGGAAKLDKLVSQSGIRSAKLYPDVGKGCELWRGYAAGNPKFELIEWFQGKDLPQNTDIADTLI